MRFCVVGDDVQYLVGGSPLSTKVLGGCRLQKGEKGITIFFFSLAGYKGRVPKSPSQAKPSQALLTL